MRHCLIFLFLLFPIGGYAEVTERIVWGEVLDVEPIVEKRNIAPQPDCDTAVPESADLVMLLRWDLREDCLRRTSSRIKGYRVEYRWDGRTYSRTMETSPGQRIPLLVRFK